MTLANRPSTFRLLAVLLASASALACGSASDVRVLAAPTVSTFTATPSTITAGEATTLAWNATGATSVTINHEVGPVTGTSAAVRPTVTTTYTLTATNGEGSTVRDVTVTVNPAPTAPVIDTFVAGPSTIAAGDDVTLMWSVRGATSLSIDQGVGPVTGTSTTARPLATTKYTLTATNAQGSVKKDVTVIVTAATAPVIASFTATPASITAGETTTLTWSVSGADTITINQGIGVVNGTSATVTPTATTTYVLTASNASGSSAKEVTVSVWSPSTPPAIGSFTATPSTLTTEEVTTLAWQVTGADTVSIDQGVGLVTGTSKVVHPLIPTTYTLTATNGAGSKTASVTVTVVPPPPVITSFTATPSTITAGGTTTLAWNVTGATSLSIDQGVGTVAGTSAPVKPLTTTTYTLSATNGGGTAKAVVTVTVEPVPPPVIASFTATPATIIAGGATTLAWSVTGASSVTIDQGVGAVTGTSTAVSPATTKTYTLTATNGGGTVAKSVTVTVTPLPPVIGSLTATPSTVVSGSSATLAWVVTGADGLSIDNGIGGVTGTSKSVTPTATTTYTLTATNAGGSTTKSVTVTVTPPLPVIASFTASPPSIYAGSSSTLAWTVTGADAVTLNQGIGTVTGTSQVVTPTATTAYVLSASNASGTVTRTVAVTVMQPPSPPVIKSFEAVTSAITVGMVSNLTWDVTGADTISIDNVVGTVSGTRKAVWPDATTTYTLSATNAGGTSTATATVTVLAPGGRWISVATGERHTVAIREDGSLWAWGANWEGQIGDGTNIDRHTPVPIGTGFVSVAAGDIHVLAIKADGSLWAWGANGDGQYGDGTTTSRNTPVRIGSGFRSVAGGSRHSLAVDNNGVLWAWGANNRGQIGDGTTAPRLSPTIVMPDATIAIAAGPRSIGIRADKTLWMWGCDVTLPVFQLPSAASADISGFPATAWDCNGQHVLTVKEDGTLWAFGSGFAGQFGIPPPSNGFWPTPMQVGSGFATAAAGFYRTIAVKVDGTLWASGNNDQGQLGDGTTTNASTFKQVDAGYLTVATRVSHVVAIKTDGSLWSWGYNVNGQLGDGSTTDRHSPVRVLTY